MFRIISLICLVLIVLLTPPTALVLISQDSIPGDSTYAIKRTMENGILVVASVNPNAKALFQVDRSQRRFTETTKLISKNRTLPRDSIRELVLQTKEADDEINDISDTTKKKDLNTKLTNSINEYNAGLHASETILASNNTSTINNSSSSSSTDSHSSSSNSNANTQNTGTNPTPTPGSNQTQNPTPTPNNSQITTNPTPTPRPTPIPARNAPDCSKNSDPVNCQLNYCESIKDEVQAAQCYQNVLNQIRDTRAATLNQSSQNTNTTTTQTTTQTTQTTASPVPTTADGSPDFQKLKSALNSININDYIQMISPDE